MIFGSLCLCVSVVQIVWQGRMSSVTVAATQMACTWDREESLSTAEELVREAARDHQVQHHPELVLEAHGDALAEAPKPRDPLALEFREAPLEGLDIDRDVGQFRHDRPRAWHGARTASMMAPSSLESETTCAKQVSPARHLGTTGYQEAL